MKNAKYVLSERGDFDSFYRRTYTQTVRMANTFLKNWEDSKDAAQEIYIKAWRKLDTYDGSSAFSTWFYSVAHNHLIDITRKKYRKFPVEHIHIEDVDDGNGSGNETLSVDMTKQQDVRLDAEKLMKSLSPKYADVISMLYFRGFQCNDIMNCLGIPSGTVKSRSHRAIKLMRKSAGLK